MTDEYSEPDVLCATPLNPVPDNHMAGYFRARDGKRLRYAIFKSETRVASGTVVLLQGRNECIEKYFEVIRHLTARGLWVATFDWRGQGGSERMIKDRHRGHVRRFADLEDDLMHFLETIVLPDTRLPFCLLAHSMGALVALSAAPRLGNRIDRMALVAPFIDLSRQRLGKTVIRLLCRLLCSLGFGWVTFERSRFPRSFKSNILTSDKARFERNTGIIKACPKLRLGPPTARWILEMLTAINRVSRHAHLDAIKVPTLILAGGKDKIVNAAAIENLANNFRAGHLLVIDGGRHELLQEADRYRLPALAAIDAFLPPQQPDLAKIAERKAAAPAEQDVQALANTVNASA